MRTLTAIRPQTSWVTLAARPFRGSLLAAMLSLTAAAAHAESLDQLKARMDAASSSLQSLSASMKKVSYTAVIKDTQTESGTFQLKKVKVGDLRIRMEIEKPDRKSIALSKAKYEIYLPKLSTVQEFNLGKYKSLVDQFVLLGFGTPTKELVKAYDMTILGEEKVEGRACSKLQLLPKSEAAKEHLKKVEMWIPLDEGTPVQQKFYMPSNDYFQTTYSAVKINPGLKDTDVQLNLPKGTKREFPQK